MNNQSEGWIKLYRSMFKWEWWDDIYTRSLFITCLLLANSTEQRWHGIVVPRGSFVTTFKKLAKKSALTDRQVRTALNHLKTTQEVTCESTHDYTIITISNYEQYQEQLTGVRHDERHTERHATDMPATCDRHTTDTKQEYNNGRIEEGNESSSPIVEEDMTDVPSAAEPASVEKEDLRIDYGKLAQYWNEKTKGVFGIVESIENNRRKMVRARIRDKGKKAFMEAIDKVCASTFLAGAAWFNFDWLIRPNNFDKVMSGNFDNKEKPNKDGNTASTNNSRLGIGTVTRPTNKGMQTDI